MDFHYQNVTQNNGQQALILKIFSPKQVLKNYCHHNKYNGPIYFLVHEEKINVQKHYTVQLMINNEVVAKATGLSRRIAEFMAAQKAISDIGKHDATIFNFIKKDRYGKINRSYSAGYLSQTDRTDSFASVTTSHCPSASPSIDAIDSMTIESNCKFWRNVYFKIYFHFVLFLLAQFQMFKIQMAKHHQMKVCSLKEAKVHQPFHRPGLK